MKPVALLADLPAESLLAGRQLSPAEFLDTPYGSVSYRRAGLDGASVLWISRRAPFAARPVLPADPRAVALAVRLLKAERAIGLIASAGLAQPAAPADFIEFTSGRPTTFFDWLGAGYVQQEPPFCPELRQAMAAAGAAMAGTLLVLDRQPSFSARAWWAGQGVSLISTETQPEGALCRELDLCYAVLALPPTMSDATLFTATLAAIPDARSCACGDSMAPPRRAGRLPAEWYRPADG